MYFTAGKVLKKPKFSADKHVHTLTQFSESLTVPGNILIWPLQSNQLSMETSMQTSGLMHF